MDWPGEYVVRYVTSAELRAAQRRESYAPIREPSFDPNTARPRGVDVATGRLYVLLPGEPDPDPWEHVIAIARALRIEDDVLGLIDTTSR